MWRIYNLPRPRAMKPSEKEMVLQGEGMDCGLKRYTECKVADMTVVSVDTRQWEWVVDNLW